MSLGSLGRTPPRRPRVTARHTNNAAVLHDLVENAARPEPDHAEGAGITFIDSATFAQAEYRLSWLVHGIFVRDQPAVIGGAHKTLKTSLVIDLALSLGSEVQTPFLGHFAVAERVRVGVMSGESGPATLQETARRIALSKGIRMEDAQVYWSFRLPRLSNDAELQALTRLLTDQEIRVVVVDPLYLCLLAGGRDPGVAANVFAMGPLLSDVCAACLEARATPILVHHTPKHAAASDRVKPLELQDLAYAGVREFFRQWLLVGRRAPYEPGTGLHQLLLSAGGSAGQSGYWAVDIEEGQLGLDFGGRRWDVTVMPAAEGRSATASARMRARQRDTSATHRALVLEHLHEHPDGDTASCLANAAGTITTRVRPTLDAMVEAGEIVEVGGIRKRNQSYRGYRLAGSVGGVMGDDVAGARSAGVQPPRRRAPRRGRQAPSRDPEQSAGGIQT